MLFFSSNMYFFINNKGMIGFIFDINVKVNKCHCTVIEKEKYDG